jgi:hypothetical protein
MLRVGRFSKTESAVRDSSTNAPVGVVLLNGSPLLPRNMVAEELPWLALNRFSYEFAFYNGVTEERNIGTRIPNLSFSVMPDKREFAAGFQSMFEIATYGARVESFSDDDGSIEGLKDLSNVMGTVWLSPRLTTDGSLTTDIKAFSKAQALLLRGSSIRMITMHVGAKNCVINGYECKKLTGGGPGWWFRFGEDTLKDCSIR